jgi:hypothetical protein
MNIVIFYVLFQQCFNCRPSDSTVSEDAGIEPSAGIIEQSMGARNRVGIGLLFRPDRLHRLADRFLEIDNCWAT